MTAVNREVCSASHADSEVSVRRNDQKISLRGSGKGHDSTTANPATEHEATIHGNDGNESSHTLFDDATGATEPKPVEWLVIALAGCTAFEVITILRQKHHQKMTAYEVRVEFDQAGRPPHVFTEARIHHVMSGFEIDCAAVELANRLSENRNRSIGATVKQSAPFHTTHEILEREVGWMQPASANI